MTLGYSTKIEDNLKWKGLVWCEANLEPHQWWHISENAFDVVFYFEDEETRDKFDRVVTNFP